MVNKILLGIVAVIIVSAGAWFISYYPLMVKKPTTSSAIPAPTKAVTTSKTISPTAAPMVPPGVTGVSAIKAYAAKQFNTSPDELVVVSSSEKDWPDTCLGLNLKACEQKPTHGFEVTFKINGQNVTYRGSEDGKNIRFVKK